MPCLSSSPSADSVASYFTEEIEAATGNRHYPRLALPSPSHQHLCWTCYLLSMTVNGCQSSIWGPPLHSCTTCPPLLSAKRWLQKSPPPHTVIRLSLSTGSSSSACKPGVSSPICKHQKKPPKTYKTLPFLPLLPATVPFLCAPLQHNFFSHLKSSPPILLIPVAHLPPTISPKFLLPRSVMTSKLWNPKLTFQGSSKPAFQQHWTQRTFLSSVKPSLAWFLGHPTCSGTCWLSLYSSLPPRGSLSTASCL